MHERSAPGRRLPSFAKNPAVRLPVERIVAERGWIAAADCSVMADWDSDTLSNDGLLKRTFLDPFTRWLRQKIQDAFRSGAPDFQK
ncbi:hypothetical protein [Sorangium sp. So ce204]|uniref:hypothetical protein n=1 Tax=Sorangium sp. So ce204 TaxID=3133288 RepID=UPI003F638A5B